MSSCDRPRPATLLTGKLPGPAAPPRSSSVAQPWELRSDPPPPTIARRFRRRAAGGRRYGHAATVIRAVAAQTVPELKRATAAPLE